MSTNVDVDKVMLVYLYLVNGLSNLGSTYSSFKSREIRKLTIFQGHTESFAEWKVFNAVQVKEKKAINSDSDLKGLFLCSPVFQVF